MKRERAVVVGASFAGLVTARVLSDHFHSVVVIDKSEFDVAHASHLHVLLKKGQALLRSLFPEMGQALLKAQCPQIDWAADTQWESKTGSFPRYSSDVQTYSFSRSFLQGLIHSLVVQRSNIIFKNAHLESLNDPDCANADLVVLAGGQHFPLNRFTGCEVNDPLRHIPIQIGYRSVTVEADSLNLNGCKQYYYQLAPPHESLGAVVCPIEEGRAIATLVEYDPAHFAKTDFVEFQKLAEKVPGNEFSRILRDARPLSSVSHYFKSSMYMRRPDKVSAFPRHVFCIGDVFCSLNPVFGQGMTCALLQVQLLDELLKKTEINSQIFHKKSAQKLYLPFLLSKMGSNTQPNFFYRYLRAFLVRCQKSPALHRKFLGVLQLENSFSALVDFKSLCSALRKSHD